MMQFSWQGAKVVLKGDPTLERSQITLKSMMKIIRKNKGGVLVELTKLENEQKVDTAPGPSSPAALSHVL